MKKILAALLLIAAPLAAQDASVNKAGSTVGGGVTGGTCGAGEFVTSIDTDGVPTCAAGGGAPTTVDYVVGTASGSLSAEVVAGDADLLVWWVTPSSLNLRASLSDETGGGLAMFNVGPAVANGATGPGYIDFNEDTDNGSNRVRLIGPASTADVTATLQANAGTVGLIDFANVWGDGIKQTFNPDATTAGINVGATTGVSAPANGDLWYDSASTGKGGLRAYTKGSTVDVALPGEDMFYMHDEFTCGLASGALVPPTCTNMQGSHTSATWASTANIEGATTFGVARGTLDATGDVIRLGGQNTTSSLMTDGFRMRTRIRSAAVSTTASQYNIWVGSHDASGGNTTAPAHGAWFSYTNTDANATPNWAINLEAASADCAIAHAGNTWEKLEITYEAGVGNHFYVDGVECSNSPLNADPATSVGEEFSPFAFKVHSIAGTGGGTHDIDYFTIGPTPVAR
jgi:hypothetical protein